MLQNKTKAYSLLGISLLVLIFYYIYENGVNLSENGNQNSDNLTLISKEFSSVLEDQFFFKKVTNGVFKNQINKEKKQEIIRTETPMNWPWRGITIVTHDARKRIDSLSISELKNKGVNFVRLRLSIRKYAKISGKNIESSKIEMFDRSDKIIKWCEKNQIAVLISHSDFPLDPDLNIKQMDREFWGNQDLLDEAIFFISDVVQYFDHWKNVVGYEFFAEPAEKKMIKGAKQPDIWRSYFDRIVKEVRVHSSKFLTYTPGPWGYPSNYNNMGEPIGDDRIIYNFHFYRPHKFTHQGSKKNVNNYTYPGIINSKYWDRDEILKEIKIPVDWCKNNGKLLFAGEFSSNARSELVGRNEYLEDVLGAFEEYEISYAYFSFNGWIGWDYNYVSQDNKIMKSKSKTKTLELLEKYWSLNAKK